MRSVGYGVIWGLLIGATVFELAIFRTAIAPNAAASIIVSLAGLKAMLIALFYQHLSREPKSVSLVYVAALLAGVGLIIGMQVSMYHGSGTP